jgi:alkanesulfonate monooxygenase SsuD/methylene tetrahydromethanopterin reductase-like flavin-dependent oxidoreductase (luciferase family)
MQRQAGQEWQGRESSMSGKLTFGYLYDFRNPPQWRRKWEDLYAETLDFITWTDTAGFSGAWVPEHHLAEDGYMPTPMVALAAIAARTKTIKLGSAVALAPLYDPVRFAEECAVLDIIAQGRVEMAAAIGYRRRETNAFGVDFGKRGFDQIANRPHAVSDPERHSGGHPQRFVRAAQVAERRVRG